MLLSFFSNIICYLLLVITYFSINELFTARKFSVVLKNDSITLVPKSSMQSFRGILKGANTHNVRDRSERV
jgi:hypothetical protein